MPPTTKYPGSPARSASSILSDSVLTVESSDEEEESNFIALLQYKDAWHLLGLREQSSRDPDEIRTAYNTCKEQTLYALERCKANVKHQHAARGSFLISQTNYLELKLNALDQALGELLPEDKEQNAYDATMISDQQKKHHDTSPRSLQQEGEIQTRRGHVNSDLKASPENRPRIQSKEHLQTQNKKPLPSNNDTEKISKQERALRDEDELDTIDIYFNPSKTSNVPKALDQSDAVSIITWDASSIFSLISNAKSNDDAASENGLSEVLGPLNKDKRKNVARGSVITAKSSEVNRAMTSPRSITDFSPSIHDQGWYKEVGHPMRRKLITTRGRLRVDPQSTSDAVIQGQMRALYEDESECMSLDFEDVYAQIAEKSKMVGKASRLHNTIDPASYDGKGGKAGGQQNRGRKDVSDEDQISTVSAEDTSVSEGINSGRTKQIQPVLEEDFYDSLIQTGMDGYNSILESSIDISNQLCEALQQCWLDHGLLLDGRSTYERSTTDEGSTLADDLTGVYTEGESTAFNTLSSFSKCGSSTREREGKMNGPGFHRKRLV